MLLLEEYDFTLHTNMFQTAILRLFGIKITFRGVTISKYMALPIRIKIDPLTRDIQNRILALTNEVVNRINTDIGRCANINYEIFFNGYGTKVQHIL